MTLLTSVLIVLEIVCCLLLIGAVLLQKSKGQGMGLAFGAGMGEQLFGAHAGNVLTKATVILAIAFLLNTTALTLLGSHGRRGSIGDGIQAAPPAGAPAVPAPVGGFPTTSDVE